MHGEIYRQKDVSREVWAWASEIKENLSWSALSKTAKCWWWWQHRSLFSRPGDTHAAQFWAPDKVSAENTKREERIFHVSQAVRRWHLCCSKVSHLCDIPYCGKLLLFNWLIQYQRTEGHLLSNTPPLSSKVSWGLAFCPFVKPCEKLKTVKPSDLWKLRTKSLRNLKLGQSGVVISLRFQGLISFYCFLSFLSSLGSWIKKKSCARPIPTVLIVQKFIWALGSDCAGPNFLGTDISGAEEKRKDVAYRKVWSFAKMWKQGFRSRHSQKLSCIMGAVMSIPATGESNGMAGGADLILQGNTSLHTARRGNTPCRGCCPCARWVRGGGGTVCGGPLWVVGGCYWPQGGPLWVVCRHNIILCLLSAVSIWK